MLELVQSTLEVENYPIDRFFNLLVIRHYLHFLETQKPEYDSITEMKQNVTQQLQILKKELEKSRSKTPTGRQQGRLI